MDGDHDEMVGFVPPVAVGEFAVVLRIGNRQNERDEGEGELENQQPPDQSVTPAKLQLAPEDDHGFETRDVERRIRAREQRHKKQEQDQEPPQHPVAGQIHFEDRRVRREEVVEAGQDHVVGQRNATQERKKAEHHVLHQKLNDELSSGAADDLADADLFDAAACRDDGDVHVVGTR